MVRTGVVIVGVAAGGFYGLGLCGTGFCGSVALAQTAPAPPPAAPKVAATVQVEAAPAPGEASAAEANKRPRVPVAEARAPSEDQLKAFRALETEAGSFQRAAQEYGALLTTIVRHHYEERRRRIVDGLEDEIREEEEALVLSRDEAIRRLEEFVDKYSGVNAHPEATPDAMYRLAALYEEKARADFDAELSDGLQPAIALYRRIIRKFPSYKEIAGVHYYLAHAYTDIGELEMAQQAWRSLVCSDQYSVQPDPGDGARVLVQPLPQDHDEAFWNQWYNKNPIPLDQLGGTERNRQRDQFGVEDEELVFVNPYTSCRPLPQEVKPDEEPRYLAEAWWQVGNFHFDQISIAGGPYALNRAEAAYERSMEFKKPPLYGVAMYKRAWTFFKQQRYSTAVNWFVNLLHYADKQEEETGDPGADFRSEAYTYIAGSLTYVDFAGPPPEHPYIPRNDALDVEEDPLVAEEKMQIAIERVQDPELIPQDKKWTVEIYKALGQEFLEFGQERNGVKTLELALNRFPLDREAPKMLNKVAELYDKMAREAQDGTAVKEEAAAAALNARTRLADYVGDTEWTRANQDDPEALQQAEQLVRRGLQRAAADHTNQARAYVAKARNMTDEAAQRDLILNAIDKYRQAAKGWGAFIDQDPNAVDAYESRFWLADARFWVVVLQLQLDQTPREAEIAAAQAAARKVRDSNEDDKFLQPAAFYLVTLADKIVDNRYREHDRSGGMRGFPKRTEVTFSGEGSDRKPVTLQIPAEMTATVTARDEYNQRIEYELDPQKNGRLYAFQAAEVYFVYGQFDEATKRFEPIMDENCGKNEWGYKAWEKLISMSNFQGDAKRSRELVEGKSCAFDEETRAAEDAIRTPVRQGVAYLDARSLYDEAEKMPEGPERDKKWREAAAAYKVALDAAPDRDEAPEAAMNGAYAYKQVGDYDKAIDMYELFISRYGSEKKLRALRDGDNKARPPTPPSPKQYESRVKFLKLAYDALANAYVLFFDYPEAARTFDTISKVPHFSEDDRKGSAQQAMNLYASLADNSGMRKARNNFAALGAGAQEIAEADFVIASSALKQWDQFSPDRGANAAARKRADAAMRRYHDANKNNPAAAKYVVDAAYWTAKTKRAARAGTERAWWQNTIAAFESYRRVAPRAADGTNSAVGSRQGSMAAEGAYVLLDQELKKKFDYDTGHHRFKGTPQEVLKAYSKAAGDAKVWFDKLQAQIEFYGSPEWGTAAVARQGSLYDSLRTGLYNTRPPALKMFDRKTEATLRRAEESDNLELQEKADALRIRVENAWRDQRDKELASADQVMVDRYGTAITLARRYNVSNPAVVRAIQRLAFFTEVIGEAKLKAYTARVKDLGYSEGMFLRIRPGLVTAPEANAMPKAAPFAGGAP